MSNLFRIEQVGQVPTNFMFVEYLYDIVFSNIERTFGEAVDLVENMVHELVETLLSKMDTGDKISLTFYHSMFDTPISIPFLKKGLFNSILVMDYLLFVTQSYKDLMINPNNSLNASAQIQSLPLGAGRRPLTEEEKKQRYLKKMYSPMSLKVKKEEKPKTRIKNLKQPRHYIKQEDRPNFYSEVQRKLQKHTRSVIQIRNKDNFCCLKSILVAKYQHDMKKKKITKKDIPGKIKLKQLVRQTAKKLNIANEPAGIQEIIRIERYLKEYQITLYDGRAGFFNKKIIHSGPFNKYFLYKVYTKTHYNVLTSMLSFFDCKLFCDYCKIPYFHRTEHHCIKTCSACKKQDCLKSLRFGNTNTSLKCQNCKQIVRNLECLRYHSEFICSKTSKCDKCDSAIYRKNHVCKDEKYCVNCKAIVDIDHNCYLMQDKFPNKARKNLIFYDFETFQENGKHIPNLVIAKMVCIKHLNNLEKGICNCESPPPFTENNRFCEWLFSKKNSVAIAHNFRAFDGVFIMEYMLSTITNFDRMPKILLKGAKLLSIEFRGLKLIDSLSFLPMPLEMFTKTFDLSELKKGFWPHDFNTRKNQNYCGTWPEPKFYGIDFMKEDKKTAFDIFYEKNKDKKFNFMKECIAYCTSDVDLLMNGCLAFRKNIQDMTKSSKFKNGVDPFTTSITIAGLCHFIFRNLMLKPDEIGIIPEKGYSNPAHSKKAIQWLEYLSKEMSIRIQHAGNGQEVKIGDYFVDGFCSEKNICFEFFGCYFHGCEECFRPKAFNQLKKRSMASVFKQHTQRLEILKNMKINGKPITFLTIWEHEWDKRSKNEASIREFLSNFEYFERLIPRDSFKGGRTESFILHFKCQPNQKIKYIDFCSLYPYIQNYRSFPRGHPVIFTKDFKSLDEYFGLIKCKVIPPNDLYFPILPMESKGRLVFALCGKCADERLYDCEHEGESRAITGTWTTEEVKIALEYKYKIIKIYEIWHFPERSETVFKDYINTFLKGKVEASGYPKDVVTEEQKDAYIEDFLKNEGILLDKVKIAYNSGKRALAKLMLNNLWGKLSERVNQTKYKVIADSVEWIELISNEQYQVNRVHYTNNKYLQVFYAHKEESTECSSKTNVVIAAFVTAYARLKLWFELNKLGKRCIYCDTDSIFYWTEEGMYEPKLGIYLGDFTNEITKEKGDHIIEMIAGGLKFYSYKTNTGYTHSLCKGITFSRLTAESINFETMKEMIFKERNKKITVDQLNFIRNNKDWHIRTEIGQKTISNTFNKRQILPDLYNTVPFGYKTK